MVSQTTTKCIYGIEGVLVPSVSGYEITFPFEEASEIEVYVTGDTNDTKVPEVSYSLDRTGATPKVVFAETYRFLEGSRFLTVIRNVDYVQGLDLRNGEVINADMLEKALDRLTNQTQQLAEKVRRTVLTSVSDTEQLTIPNASARANMVLAFDDNGDTIALPTSELAEKIGDLSAIKSQIVQVKTIADTNTADIKSLETRKANEDSVASRLLTKADKANTYTKTEVDNSIALKANQSDMDNVQDYIGVDITKKRNLWDEQWEVGSISHQTGALSPNGEHIRSSNFIPVKANTIYCHDGNEVVVNFYNSSLTCIQYVKVASTDASAYGMGADVHGGKTFTTPNGCAYIKFRTVSTYGTSYKGDIFFAEGTSGVYVPYVPQMFSLNNVADYIGVPLNKPRNLLNATLGTTTANGVTCTANGDGTYTINGTASGDCYFKVAEFSLPMGSYKMVGTTSSSFSTYRCFIQNPAELGNDVNKQTFTTNETSAQFYIKVGNGVTVNNVLVHPMVTEDLSATYADFVPYVPTLREGSIVAYGGSDSTGYYVRFSNGVQMCWKTIVSDSVNCNSAWGGGYASTTYSAGQFPVPFASNPVQSISASSETSSFVTLVSYIATSTAWSDYAIWRATSVSGVRLRANAFAIGRWK